MDEKHKQRILSYMQQTNQTKIMLVYNERYVMIERKDGATNQYQEHGYHDYLDLTWLPLPIRLELP